MAVVSGEEANGTHAEPGSPRRSAARRYHGAGRLASGPRGGGFPICAEGLLAGEIGVSGASAHEAAELALAALTQAGFDFDFGGGQIGREEGEDG